MKSALSNQFFYTLNQGKYLSEMFTLPKGEATVYVSTHLELGESDLLHYHDEPHLSFILNGGVIDKRKSVNSERISGEFIFFHAGEPHRTISKVFPTKYVSLQFHSDFFKQNPNLENALKSSVEKTLHAKFAMLKIYREFIIRDEFSDSSIEMLLLDLIGDKQIIKGKRPFWLNRIVEILNDKWNEEITISDLALAVNVHPKTISKYFPRYFDCTLGEYRRRIKIEKSLMLIKNSKSSLTEIAYQCGFYDQSHFTGTFKELTGFRPKEFQKV